jgi:hypothetical protein
MGHIKRGDLDDAMVLIPLPDEIDELSEILLRPSAIFLDNRF